ncbi:hypothetical protein, partial [Metallibacterium scheffleri]|uniref:hypothetical protein n=1 Tax=Metallibacterium scheffleri TaxID=993689 RepID=UPI0023F42689
FAMAQSPIGMWLKSTSAPTPGSIFDRQTAQKWVSFRSATTGQLPPAQPASALQHAGQGQQESALSRASAAQLASSDDGA